MVTNQSATCMNPGGHQDVSGRKPKAIRDHRLQVVRDLVAELHEILLPRSGRDGDRLLEEAILAQHDRRDARAFVVVQAVDVIHDPRLVGLDRHPDQVVLQFLALAGIRVVQDDLLQQLDQDGGELGFDEDPPCDGDLVRVRIREDLRVRLVSM